MRQIAVTHHCDKSLRCCDKSPHLHCCCDKAACSYFITALRYVPQIQTTLNSCDRSQRQHSVTVCDNDFHMSHKEICWSNLSRWSLAAICCIVCPMSVRIIMSLRLCPHVSRYFQKQRFFLRLHLPSTRKQHSWPQIWRFLKTLSWL